MKASVHFDAKTNQPMVTSENTFPLRDPSISNDIRLPKDQLPKGIQIQPVAGFCYKTKRTPDGSKVFINIVTHEKLQKPGTKKKLDAEGNEVEGLNIPMSVGAAHFEEDKKGVVCTSYDIVVHPEVLVDLEADSTGKFREFLCQLGIQCLEQKYKEPLDKRYKLPKLSYFGAEISPQTIQDRNNMPTIEEVTNKTTKPKTAPKEQPAPIVQRTLKDLPLKSYWCEVQSGDDPLILNDNFNNAVTQSFSESEFLPNSSVYNLLECTSTSIGEYVEPLSVPPTATTQALLVEANFQAYDKALLKAGTKSSSSATSDLHPLSVEIAAYTMKIAVPGYKPITMYLGVGIVPPRSYHSLVKIVGSVSLYRLIVVLPLDKRPFKDIVDPGSKPWSILQALRDESRSDISTLDSEIEAWETSTVGNVSLSEQRYPGSRILNVGRVDEDTELPEDLFHRKDAASSWIISQREQSRLDKAKKYDDERKVLQNDPNVEFVDMQKPQNSEVNYGKGEHNSAQNATYRAAAEVTAKLFKSQFADSLSQSAASASAENTESHSKLSAKAKFALNSLQTNLWTELLD